MSSESNQGSKPPPAEEETRSQRHELIRRILLALDASTSRGSLDAAAELAARYRAELAALFVEDEDLLRFVDFPHVRQVSLPTGRAEDVDSGSLARQLRAIAREAQRNLASASDRRRVRWSFEVVRGSLVREMVSAASQADLIILERSGRSLARPKGGSPASTVVEHTRRPVLVLSEGRRRGPVVAVLSHPDYTQTVLGATNELTEEGRRPLHIMLAPDRPGDRQLLRQQALNWLELRGRRATLHRLSRASAEQLARTLRTVGASLAVFSAEVPTRGVKASELLDHVDVPILLAR